MSPGVSKYSYELNLYLYLRSPSAHSLYTDLMKSYGMLWGQTPMAGHLNFYAFQANMYMCLFWVGPDQRKEWLNLGKDPDYILRIKKSEFSKIPCSMYFPCQ